MDKKRKQEELKLWKKSAWDLLYLTQCSIHATIPKLNRVKKMDLRKVYSLSCNQSLESITYIALERLMKINDTILNQDLDDLFRKWKESKNKVIRKTILMDTERKKLFAYLEQHKIWHLPLKGVIIGPMYPEFGMRQMADNDILFDGSFRQNVRDWFIEQGYTIKSYGESNHDEYHKEPIYNFEMHTDLFHEKSNPKFSSYYLSLKNKLKLVPGKDFEYYMSDEDFYIYLLTHEYKHYSNSGTGLRSLLDLYIYNNVKKNIDRNYLDNEFSKIGLYEFEKEMRELAIKVFSLEFDYDTLTQKEKKLFCELLFGRTYGTINNYFKNHVQKALQDEKNISIFVKAKYIFKRLFPNKKHMDKWCELYSPFFWKHKWLRPVAYIWRIFKGDKIMMKKEVNALSKVRDDKSIK